MTVDVRATNKSQFEVAKRRWAFALALKLAMFAIGLWFSLGDGWSYSPLVLLGLALASEFLQLASDQAKGQAEAVLRMLDRCRSFGYQISEADLRDLALAASKRQRTALRSKSRGDVYFSTTEGAGPRAAICNLQESAWYTRHLAERMWMGFFVAIVACIASAVGGLLVVTRATLTPVGRDQISRAATAWLLLLVSLNMIKSVIGYWKMARRCERTEQACAHLLAGDVSEVDALRQWHEYQIARAAAPLMPDWIWGAMSDDLARGWTAREG